MGFSQPYVFHSGVGVDFQFEMFKKDSNFLQWNTRIGIQQRINPNTSFKTFLLWQHFNTLEGALDSVVLKQNKTLPPNLDIQSSNIGGVYESNHLDNLFNPLRGSDFNFTFSFGQKKINKNKKLYNLDRRSIMSSVPVDLAKSRRIIGGGSCPACVRDNAAISD